jgi:hypothetical protein
MMKRGAIFLIPLLLLTSCLTDFIPASPPINYETAVIVNETDAAISIVVYRSDYVDSVKIVAKDSVDALKLFAESPMAHFASHGALYTIFNSLEFSQIKLGSENGREVLFFPNTPCPNLFRIDCWENEYPVRSVFKIKQTLFD